MALRGDRDPVSGRLAMLVAQPQRVDVADRTVALHDVKRVAVRGDVEVDRRAHEQRHHQPDADAGPEGEIEDRARPEDMLPDIRRMLARAFLRLILQRDVADQPARLADLVHHLVAGVDAQPAGDAFELLAVADVDSHRTDVETGLTVDAIAVAGNARLAARLATPFAIGDGDRILVHHRGLDARPGAGIDADLLAREAAEGEGGGGGDGDRGVGHGRGRAMQQVMQERRRVGEVEHPGTAGGDADQQPQRPLRHPLADLLEVPLLPQQADAGVAVALDDALDEDEQVGPDRLRAGIAAPHPPHRRGEQEEPEPRHDEKAGDEVEFVRPDLDHEEEEAPVRQVDEHRLVGQRRTAVPADPRGDVVDAQHQRHQHPFQGAEMALHAAREDGFARSVKRGGFARFGGAHRSLSVG
ncbi:hypothetical protein SDC9_19911 [bioreactor metagenome]|uniref:Uncharacterized protein n=1 Tax=bioreactor metagenome TaxID=1076179 RepID=A0A644U5A8_9ZZZZ